MYIRYVFLERVADEDEQDIIDSTLIEPESDTNVPFTNPQHSLLHQPYSPLHRSKHETSKQANT